MQSIQENTASAYSAGNKLPLTASVNPVYFIDLRSVEEKRKRRLRPATGHFIQKEVQAETHYKRVCAHFVERAYKTAVEVRTIFFEAVRDHEMSARPERL